MITQLQQAKLDKAFNHLDVDRDGQVEYEDVIALATRILGAFNELPTGIKGTQVISTFTEFWETLMGAIDLDGARRISPQQWRAGMTTAFIDDEAGVERALRPGIEATLAVVDHDDDGLLRPAEFRALQSAFGTTPEDVELAFTKLDLDGDGALVVGEVADAGRQFYVSSDTQAPGNWFFGRV